MVDKQKKNHQQAQLAKDLFWYKEELLKRVTATWREVCAGKSIERYILTSVMKPGSLRHGTLSLRDQSFTPSLLDILKKDDFDIRLSVRSQEKSDRLATTDFIDIRVTVTNGLGRSGSGVEQYNGLQY